MIGPADGGPSIAITSDVGPSSRRNSDPAWSPDGSAIVFSSNRGGGDLDLWIASDLPGPACSIEPDSLDFGVLEPGGFSDTTFIIKNVGDGLFSGVVFDSCSNFSIVSGDGPFNLAPGESITVTVHFAPPTYGYYTCTIKMGVGLCTDVFCKGFADETIPVALQNYDSWWASDHVSISWSLLGVGSDVSYEIFRMESPGEDFMKLPDPEVDRKGNQFVFKDRSVAYGTTYSYRVNILIASKVATFFETTLTTPTLGFALYQNAPNPFNPTTTISFTVPHKVHVNLSIYSIDGKLIKTLVDDLLGPGTKEVNWDGADTRGNPMASGIYLYRLKAGKKVLTRKMVLLR